MSNPLVSIVIPTYKRPLALKNAIDSVLMQSYENIEVVVVDDNNSSDPLHHETQRVVTSYSAIRKIIYLKQEVQQGANAARNAGILASNGEYIAFLDDDDVWFKEKLEVQVMALEKDKNIGFIYCNMIIVYNGNEEGVSNFNINSCSFNSLIERGEGICTSALMVRKSILLDLGGFDVSLKSLHDYELLLRLSKNYKHSIVMKPLFTYIVNSDGISMNYNLKFLGKKQILDKYKGDYLKLGKKYFYSKQNSLLGQYAILSGRKSDSIKSWFISLKYNPVQFKAYISIILVIVGGAWLYQKTSNIYYFLRDNLVNK